MMGGGGGGGAAPRHWAAGPQNVYRRLAGREVLPARSGAAANAARSFYQEIVPDAVVRRVSAPDAHLVAFTPAGDALVGFSRSRTAVVAYRFRGPWAHTRGERAPPNAGAERARKRQRTAEVGGAAAAADGAPAGGLAAEPSVPVPPLSFEGYFDTAWAARGLCAPGERLCRDFFVPCCGGRLALFASASAPRLPHEADDSSGAAAAGDGRGFEAASAPSSAATAHTSPAVTRSVPVLDSCALHLVRLADGRLLDSARFDGDFLVLHNNACASLLDERNLLAVLGVRSQAVHIFHVQEGEGRLLRARALGPTLFEDDGLVLGAADAAEARWKAEQGVADTDVEPDRDVPTYAGVTAAAAAATAADAAGAGEGTPTGLLPNPSTHARARTHARAYTNTHGTRAQAQPQPQRQGARAPAGGGGAEAGGGDGGGQGDTDVDGTGTDGEHIGGVQRHRAPGLLDGLHQRLLSFLYRQLMANTGAGDAARVDKLERFYCHFEDFEGLVLHRAQLLDSRHLLLRLGRADALTPGGALTSHDAAQVHSGGIFFVVFDFVAAHVVDVRQGTDEQLHQLVEAFCDHFAGRGRLARYASSVANCEHSKLALRRMRRSAVMQSGLGVGLAQGGSGASVQDGGTSGGAQGVGAQGGTQARAGTTTSLGTSTATLAPPPFAGAGTLGSGGSMAAPSGVNTGRGESVTSTAAAAGLLAAGRNASSHHGSWQVASLVVRRALGSLPAPTPCCTPSPYLDSRLFRYDERLVLTPQDRPRPGQDHSVRFQLRADVRAVAFRIGAGSCGGVRAWSAAGVENEGVGARGDVIMVNTTRCKALGGYIFHPTQPFVISIQHASGGAVELNFHFRWAAGESDVDGFDGMPAVH